MPWTVSQTRCVVVIGSKPGEGGGLFATDATDLGMRTRIAESAQTDTVHAGDQVEPTGEIAVLANGEDQLLEFGLQQPLEPVDLLLPERLGSAGPGTPHDGLAVGHPP